MITHNLSIHVYSKMWGKFTIIYMFKTERSIFTIIYMTIISKTIRLYTVYNNP